ncbi:MAG: hypothetical protein GEU91_22115 [Rhizobiales bacterium]|nr:hypothetical protein [Hyphomicrobiales bacterium]
MTAFLWTMRACRRALTCAAVAAAMTGAAAAQQADESNPLENAPDVQFLRGLLSGMGVNQGEGAGIDYRERSPLVVPPQLTLPPPETNSVAERNPNWPVDQDVRRTREAAAARRRTVHYSDVEEGRVLRADELAPGPRGAPPAVLGPTTTPEEGGRVLSPSALGYVGNLVGTLFDQGKPESKPFTGEPPRTALTAPPPGYQTPAPNQPYGLGKQRYEPKAFDPMDQPARGGN